MEKYLHYLFCKMTWKNFFSFNKIKRLDLVFVDFIFSRKRKCSDDMLVCSDVTAI